MFPEEVNSEVTDGEDQSSPKNNDNLENPTAITQESISKNESGENKKEENNPILKQTVEKEDNPSKIQSANFAVKEEGGQKDLLDNETRENKKEEQTIVENEDIPKAESENVVDKEEGEQKDLVKNESEQNKAEENNLIEEEDSTKIKFDKEKQEDKVPDDDVVSVDVTNVVGKSIEQISKSTLNPSEIIDLLKKEATQSSVNKSESNVEQSVRSKTESPKKGMSSDILSILSGNLARNDYSEDLTSLITRRDEKKSEESVFIKELDKLIMPSELTITSEFIAESVQEEETFDPLPYYEIYINKMKELRTTENVNRFLHKRLSEYYAKRKMYHVLQDNQKKYSSDRQTLYERRLDELQDLLTQSRIQCEKMSLELFYLREKKSALQNQVTDLYKKLQESELEVAKDILSRESDDVSHRQKVVNRWMQRQKIQLDIGINMRMKYIKIKNRLAETQEKLDKIVNLGPGIHLSDYEQMKLDNRNLQDKLEEKELELTNIRKRCQNAMQVLAHIREKIKANCDDIEMLMESYLQLEDGYAMVREDINTLQMERDRYRKSTEKLKKQNLLLQQPKILRDMENTNIEIKQSKKELLALKMEYQKRSRIVDKMRQVMENPQLLKQFMKEKLLEKIDGDSYLI